MKINLTKEEMTIINDLCFQELIEISRFKNNKFVDKKQIDNYIEKINIIADKMIED